MTLINILKNKYLPFLFAVPLFFSANRYEGIIHDAILYITQYVYTIDPLRFWGDPAFEYGNQDSLGFFSPFFGIFLETFGVSKGSFIFTVLMQFFWIVAAVFVIKSLLRLIRQRFWILPVSILFVIFFTNGMAFSHIYFFDFVSSYACSRALSIVMGFIALAFLFAQKKSASLIFILLGTAVHPITAGWCLPFWMFYFYPRMRMPIIVFSLVFPLTFLLHWGRFDVLSEDWLARPLAFKPEYEDVSKYLLLFVFFLVQIRSSKIDQVKKISCSLCVLIAISFYWHMWAGYGEHLFLYQVQPWRAVWLPSIIAVPIIVCNIKDVIRKFVKKNGITSKDLAYFLLFVSFFASRNVVLISAVALVLVMRKEQKISIKEFIVFFAGFAFAGYLIQQYLTWCLQGFPSFFGFDYMDLYRIRDSFLLYQFVFSVVFIVFFIKRRQVLPVVVLFISIACAKFMLLPALALYLAFFPKKDKIKFWGGGIAIVLLILFDGLIDVDARRFTLVEGVPRNLPWMFFASTVSMVVIGISKKISYLGIAVWLIVCGMIAVESYNSNSLDWRRKEMQLDQYLHRSIFPQVKERGKMLFWVSGEYELEPRLQFMSGSYLSRSTLVGSLFNKGHYRMGLERSHLLYQKERNPQLDKYFVYSDILKKISDVDTLIDRVNFLCGINEITCLVTDKAPLPFVKEDSAMVREDQKVFLYGCPPVEQDVYLQHEDP